MPARKPPGLDEFEQASTPSQVTLDHEKDGGLTASSRSASIRTLAALIEAVGLPADTARQDGDSEFVVVDWKANVWEQGAVISGRHRRLPLWQVTARFRPRRIAALLLPVPLVFKLPNRRMLPLAEPKPGAILRTFLFPDTQIGFWRDYRTAGMHPFHDRRAIDCAMQIMRDYRPDSADFLGDVWDLPMFQKKFPVGPELRNLTQPAFVEGAFILAKVREILDSFGGKVRRPIHIVPGNHDKRLLNAMRNSDAEEASDLRPVFDSRGEPLVSIARIIDAEKLGVEIADTYPDGRIIWNSNVWGLHGSKIGGGKGGTVRKYLADAPSISSVFGHVHRVEQAWITTDSTVGERERMAWSPGCLCRIDGAVPSNQRRNDWQQGCGGLEYEIGGAEYFAPEQMRIQAGRSIWRGQVYQGQDYTEELIEWARAVGWENATDYARKDR